METVLNKFRCICLAAWDRVCSYYSLVPFGRIMLFNLTVPLILDIILSLCGVDIGTAFIYIAANVLFCYFYTQKSLPANNEQLDSKKVFKRLIITVIADSLVYFITQMLLLIYFILNLDKLFP